MQDTTTQNKTKRAEITTDAKLNPSEPVATMHGDDFNTFFCDNIHATHFSNSTGCEI
jgi:hypothetical protein